MNDPSLQRSAAELARAFVETLGGARPGRLLDLFAEEAWVHTAGSSRVSGRRRPKEFLGMLKKLSTVMPSAVPLRIESLIGEGDQAAAMVRGEGVTADGRPYHNHYVFWVQAAAGRIVLLCEFMDTLLAEDIFGAAAAA